MNPSLKEWLKANAEMLGLPIAVIGVLTALLCAWLLLRPVEPSVREQGRVIGVGLQQGKFVSRQILQVQIHGERDIILVRRGADCRIGDSLIASHVKQKWGYRHTIARADFRPCTRPRMPAPFS